MKSTRNLVLSLVMVGALVLGAIAAFLTGTPPKRGLDLPGAMEAVKKDQPDHYRRITEILKVASDLPCQEGEFGRVVEAKYEARDGRCSFAVMTSYPPKRRLSFTLGDTRYSTVVTMRETSSVAPAK